MKPNIQYEDLYKFTVSIGLVLLGLTIVIPWALLGIATGTGLTTTQFQELTPLGQDIAHQQQLVIAQLIKNIYLIIRATGFVGVFFLVLGLILWRKKQILLDEMALLERERKVREAKDRALNPIDEIMQKNVGNWYRYRPARKTSQELVSELTPHIYLTVARHQEIKQYFDEIFHDQLFTKSHLVRPKQMGDFEFKFLQAKNKKDPSVIVRLSFCHTEMPLEWITDEINRTLLVSQIPQETFASGDNLQTAILLVVPESLKGHYKQQVEQQIVQLRLGRLLDKIEVILLTEESLDQESKSISKLIQDRIFPQKLEPSLKKTVTKSVKSLDWKDYLIRILLVLSGLIILSLAIWLLKVFVFQIVPLHLRVTAILGLGLLMIVLLIWRGRIISPRGLISISDIGHVIAVYRLHPTWNGKNTFRAFDLHHIGVKKIVVRNARSYDPDSIKAIYVQIWGLEGALIYAGVLHAGREAYCRIGSISYELSERFYSNSWSF